MAKTLYEIDLNYNEALSRAGELEALAGTLKQLADTEFGGCLDQIGTCWKGEGAHTYVGRGRSLQRKLSRSAGDLMQSAQTIRSAAERIRTADLAARAAALAE